MKKIRTKFKDLFVVNTKVFRDKRGWLKEEFKKNFIKKNLIFTLVSGSSYANKKSPRQIFICS